MNRTQKEQAVAALNEKMLAAQAAIIAEFRGLDVATATEIRKTCRENEITYQVVKNTLAKRAAMGTPLEVIADDFRGPIVLVLGQDPVTPAKVLTEFAKTRADKFVLKAGVVEGQKLDPEGIEALAKMPGMQELRGMLAGVIAGPASKLVRLLATPGQQLARVLDARREEMDKAA